MFEYGFSIWWNELRAPECPPASWSPPVRWCIKGEGAYLLVEIRAASGVVSAIECPIRGVVRAASAPLWNQKVAVEGHPVFAHSFAPWEHCISRELTTFVFEHSHAELKIHWGVESRALRSGRCMFGFDANDELVAIGVTEIEPREREDLLIGIGVLPGWPHPRQYSP